MTLKRFSLQITSLVCFSLLASPLAMMAQAVAAASPTSAPTTIASTRDADVPSLEDLGLARAGDADAVDTTQTTAPTTTPPAPAAGAPPANDGLSLDSLGFSSTQTQANTTLQARLDKRTRMLKIHQKLGVITLAPLLATLFVAGGAKSHFDHASSTVIITPPSDANVDLHIALGSLTASLYGATAYYAIFAPKIKGTPTRGAIKVHKYLIYIHGPGMILTPILGEMALSQEEKGQKVHGIASAHGAVAAVTAMAYTAAIISVSWPIHLKF